LRSDFYPRISELPGLVALKEGAGQYDLLPATLAEIGQMIRRPTAAAGLRFEVDLVTEERLDDTLRDEAARNPASLPLLEFALEELYKERNEEGVLTFAAHRHLNGVGGALARRAEQVFEGLPPGVQAALPVVLRALVTLAPAGELTVSKSPQQGALSSSPEVTALVDAFVRARLFVAKLADDGSATVELAHEALLAHWPRLSRWLEEDREGVRAGARVAAQAALWKQNGRSPDYLLAAGKPLSEAAELLASRGAEIGDTERQLVAASLARERRRRRRRHGVMAALLALALIAGASALAALAARHTAEMRREKALGLIAYMLGDLDDKLDPDVSLDIRDSTSGKVLGYFRSLAGQADRADQLLEAKAWGTSSEVRRLRGRPQEAEAAARQSLALAETLARRDPRDDEARLALGRGHNYLGMADQAAGDLEAALRQYRTAAAILDAVVTRHPGRNDWLGEAATPHSNLVNVLLKKQDLLGALPECRRTLAILGGLVAREPQAEKWQLFLANTNNGLYRILFGRGDFAGARQALLASIALTRRLLSANSANAYARQLMAIALEHSAELAEMQGSSGQAREQCGEALSILSDLARRDPDNMEVAERSAGCHAELGRVLAPGGDPRPVLAHTRAGTEILHALLRQDPGSPSLQAQAARLQEVAGRALLLGGDAGGAVRELGHAVAVLEPLGKAYQVQLATTLAVLGDARAATGERTAARTAWSRAVALLAPNAQTAYHPLALDAWARSSLQLGREEEARPVLARLAAIGYRPALPFPGAGASGGTSP
jgi:tetratricopeptide (TPR) repeat protein